LRSRVAVLIVNCRRYDDLDRVLASVATVVAADDEIVVFDQLTDAAQRKAVGARHRRVTWLFSSDNLGFAKAVNQAASATAAPMLLLLNPDAVVEGPVLDQLAGWLDTHPDVALAGPRVVDEDGGVQASARRFPSVSTAFAGRSTWLSQHFPNNWLTRRNLLARDASEAVTVDWLAGSCVMIRRDVFDRLGGMDEGYFLYWEDADLAWRARDLGFTCTYLPTVTVRHVGGRSAGLDPAPAIRAFHSSAYRLYAKRVGTVGRWTAPLARFALWARGEWRVWRFGR
jgi:N-acetylglucosaminyl-diphospho-decaprenol L-rhamnosyltransferase